MKNAEIKTTGQLRSVLAKAAQDVISGEMDIERAQALQKIAKNISDSLYSETKIAMFAHEVGNKSVEMGELKLGDPNE